MLQWSGACYRQFVGGSSQLCYLVGIAVGGALCMTLLRHLSPRRVLLVALSFEAALAFLLSGVQVRTWGCVAETQLGPITTSMVALQVFWGHALVRFFLAISSSHLFTSAAVLSKAC